MIEKLTTIMSNINVHNGSNPNHTTKASNIVNHTKNPVNVFVVNMVNMKDNPNKNPIPKMML